MKIKKVAGILLAGYAAIAVLFYFIAGDSLQRAVYTSDMVSMKTTCGDAGDRGEVRHGHDCKTL